MRMSWRRVLAHPSILLSSGTLWAFFGCATDAQLRDFLSTSIIRVFWQTFGTALQSAIVGAAG